MIRPLIFLKKPTRIGLAIIILGALFKIMHWPGAPHIFVVGCASTIVLQLWVLSKTKAKTAKDYLISLFIVAFISYFMLKLMFWPYSIIPLSIAGLTLIIALILQIVSPKNGIFNITILNKGENIIYLTSSALVIIGAVFKIMHWHGAKIMLITGLSLVLLIFLKSNLKK